MKYEIIDSKNQIEELCSKIYGNAEKTYTCIKQNIESAAVLELFTDIKFNKFGCDPIKGTPLNFIEQINQMFSDLVVLAAVEELLATYPNKQFEVAFGAKAGVDIQSVDKMVVAECFAATTVNSNSKLSKDAKKLMKLSKDVSKYIFFYSQNDSDDKLERKYKMFPEITFRRVEKL